MASRFVIIWFPDLKTDWFSVQQPELRNIPFVVSLSEHGRLIVAAANKQALSKGIYTGMAVADARAILPDLKVSDDIPLLSEKLLNRIALSCIRFTDIVGVNLPDGIVLNATGCAHLWKGEENYVNDISRHFSEKGYRLRVSMADTIGAAWAIAHFSHLQVLGKNRQMEVLLTLPPEALRLEKDVTDLLHKLGLHTIRHFINMPRSVLRRRFGNILLTQLDQVLGNKEEWIVPVIPVELFRERLPCLDPIVTITGIEIALQRLLDSLCTRLEKQNKGIRKAVFSGFRVDGKIESIQIGTHRATHHAGHLFSLFNEKLNRIEPDLGIELFLLEAVKTDDCIPKQEKLWGTVLGLQDPGISEFMDRLSNRLEDSDLKRFLPAQHYLPEKSYTPATSLADPITTKWMTDRPRPIYLLEKPQPVDVAAPIPDYPPMHFRYLGELHTVKKADGPERIEQEWWIRKGPHRDYYTVEDEQGRRYWLFRSGHYSEEKTPKWFIHGFFA